MEEAILPAARHSSGARAAGVGAQVGRSLWALFFLGGAVFNAVSTLSQPQVYRAFADLTFFGWYRQLLLSVAVPHATAITSLVVVLELSAGLLMLGRGLAVRAGLIATAAWVVFLTPSMGWYSVWCPLLAAIPLSLLRYDYGRSVPGLLLGVVRR